MPDDAAIQHARYHRQILLRQIGREGQQRLAEAHALIVGCGALGTVSAELLTRAGVGTLTIVDRDVVEWTNLHRQILFDERDARERAPKAEAARSRLEKINQTVRIRPVVADFSWRIAERILLEHDGPPVAAIIDGTDNFETRYLINDLAVKHAVPYIYGAAVGTAGMTMTILPGASPCLRCAFEEPPEPGSPAAGATCDMVGVLNSLTAIIGAQQAASAMQVLLNSPDLAPGRLHTFDPWRADFRTMDLTAAKRDDCPCCARRDFPFLTGRRAADAVTLCGRNSVQITPERAAPIDLEALAARLAPHGDFTATRFLARGTLHDERGDSGSSIELTLFPDGRAIISGTSRPDAARAIHARYIGA